MPVKAGPIMLNIFYDDTYKVDRPYKLNPIREGYWYIVSFKDFRRMFLIPYRFENIKAAKFFLTLLDKNYGIVTAKEAIDNRLKFTYKRNKYARLNRKYIFPHKNITQHQKMIFRKQQRRRISRKWKKENGKTD